MFAVGFNQQSEKSNPRQGPLFWIPRRDEPGVLQGLPGAEVQGPPAAGVFHKLNTIAGENERYNVCIYVHITQKEIHRKRV